MKQHKSLKVTDDVKFTYQDYVFDVNYIEKEPNSDIINIYGKIKRWKSCLFYFSR